MSDLAAGHVIRGKYRVEHVLGKGGMGVVYQVTHTRMGTRLALKLLNHDLSGDERVLARFEREAVATASLHSRHVVRVYDVDTSEVGVPFLVMELLKGGTIAARYRQGAPPTTKTVIDWMIQTCSAIHEAHEVGVIHRDLKPSNLFVTEPEGTLKVVDFGISKIAEGAELTLTEQVLGTPQYMPPEQLTGQRIDGRADQWALAAIGYRLLSGRLPCETVDGNTGGALPIAIAIARLEREAEPLASLAPKLPRGLGEVIDRALRRSPEERYDTAKDFADELTRFGSGNWRFEEVKIDRSNPGIRLLSERTSGPAINERSTERGLGGPGAVPGGTGVHESLPEVSSEAIQLSWNDSPQVDPELSNPPMSRTMARTDSPVGGRARWVWVPALLGVGLLGSLLVAWQVGAFGSSSPPPTPASSVVPTPSARVPSRDPAEPTIRPLDEVVPLEASTEPVPTHSAAVEASAKPAPKPTSSPPRPNPPKPKPVPQVKPPEEEPSGTPLFL